MTRKLATLLALALTLTTSGCATIFKGSHSSISVTSTPSGAEVWVSGTKYASTPCQLNIAAEHDVTVELRKPGYRPVNYILTRSVDAGWVVADILGPPTVGAGALLGALLGYWESDHADAGLYLLLGTAIAGSIGTIVFPLVDGVSGNWNSLGPEELDATLQPDSLAH